MVINPLTGVDKDQHKEPIHSGLRHGTGPCPMAHVLKVFFFHGEESILAIESCTPHKIVTNTEDIEPLVI